MNELELTLGNVLVILLLIVIIIIIPVIVPMILLKVLIEFSDCVVSGFFVFI